MTVVCVSFNKKSNNAQGGQCRVNPTPVNSTESNTAYATRTIPNGSHVQPQFHGKFEQDFLLFFKKKIWFFCKLVFSVCGYAIQ